MDLILSNGKIRTLNDKYPIVEAVAIKGNRIQNMGMSEDMLKLKTDDTKVIDLQGKTVVPGFNDSHMHLVNYGYTLMQVDLNSVRSMDELQSEILSYIDENKIESGSWIRARGWNHDYFNGEKRFPNRHDLDKISSDYPIVATRTCGHVTCVNSKALEVLNITKNTPQVDGGHFDLDESGEPLGIFRENALSMVYDALPNPTVKEIKQMIVNAVSDMNVQGITSAQTDDFESLPGKNYDNVMKAYLELKDEGKLTMRVYEQYLIPDIDTLKKFFNEGYGTGWGDEIFKIGPLKLLLDGSIGARTAALNEPYSDDPSTMGILTTTMENLCEIVNLAHENNNQIAIHGIGDKAMYMAIDAIEKSLSKTPNPDHRHGIVHAQITDQHILNKLSELNMVTYIQPFFLDYDWKIVKDRVGEQREKTSYNWKTMLEKNIAISCGSDAPVDSLNVMYGIYEAVTRKDMDGNPNTGWLTDQSLTVEEALTGYTMGGAYTSFEENIKGSIEPGKLADMVVLSEDIFRISKDSIKDVKIDMTIFDGKIVYKRG